MIERFVDYLQFQCSIPKSVCIFNEFEQISGVAFYPIGFRDGFGARYYFGNPKSPLCLVVISGVALEKRRQWGIGDIETLEWAMTHDAKFSRIDFAVTEWVEDNLVQVEDIQKWYEKGLISSSLVASGAKIISGYAEEMREQIQTFYIGDLAKRSKRGLFRAYDKGLELGIGEYLATRLELEERGEKAHLSALRLQTSGSISGVFRSRFDVKSEDFERLMDAPAIGTQRGKSRPKTEKEEEMDKRYKWLMEQIAPALKEFVDFETENDKSQMRLAAFFAASGITNLVRKTANDLSEIRYYDKLISNELVERSSQEGSE